MAELTIEQLRRALVPPATPPEERVMAFRALVLAGTGAGGPGAAGGTGGGTGTGTGSGGATGTGTGAARTPLTRGLTRGLQWVREHWLLAIAATVAAAVAAVTLSFVLDINPPAGVVRNLAHELGLPVESQHLRDARATAEELQEALVAGDREAVQRHAALLASQLADLDADERAELAGVDDLLERASDLAATPAADPGAGGGGAGSTTTLAGGGGTAEPSGTPTQGAQLPLPGDGQAASVTSSTTSSIAPSTSTSTSASTTSTSASTTTSSASTTTTTTTSAPTTSTSASTTTSTAAPTSTSASSTTSTSAGPGPVVRVEVAPRQVTVAAGQGAGFTVRGFDAAGSDLGDMTGASTFVITPDGQCTGPVCTATKAGPHTVTATRAGISDSAPVNVVAGPVARIDIAPPAVQTTPFVSRAFTVRSADTYGNDTGDVTAAATFTIAPDGSCQTNACSAATAGPHTVTACAGGLVATAALEVVPGSVDRITVSPARSSAIVGAVQLFTVEAFDVGGNRLLDVTAAARFRISPDGSCDGNGCRAATPGPHQVTVDVDGKTATAVLDAIIGPTTSIVLSPPEVTAQAGTLVPFSVRGVDVLGNDTGDLTARAALTIDGGSCAEGSCAVASAGVHTVTAAVDGLTATAALHVVPGPTTRLQLTPAIATVRAGIPQPYVVQGLDAFGNSTGDMTAQATLAVAPNGTCGQLSCSATRVGPHTVTARLGNAVGTSSLVVVPGPVERIELSPGRATVTAGEAMQYGVRGFDAYDNVIGDVTSLATLAITPDGDCEAGVCTATHVGAHTVTARIGEAADEASLAVQAGPLAQLLLSPSCASIVAGTYQVYEVEGVDAFGNPLGDVTDEVVFSVSPDGWCEGSVCGASTAGPHTVTASLGDVATEGSLEVQPGTLERLVLSPSQASIIAGSSQDYRVEGFDGYGNSLGDLTGDASFVIGPDGDCEKSSCRAVKAGKHTVHAAVGEMMTETPLTVLPGEIDRLQLDPAESSITRNSSQPYKLRAFDAFGNPLGSVEKDAIFTIEPDGACKGQICSASIAGPHIVTATIGDATATASLEVRCPPGQEGSSTTTIATARDDASGCYEAAGS